MRYLLSLALAAILASPVYVSAKAAPEKAAASSDPAGEMGGFEGPISGAEAASVSSAKSLPQDARVVLKGHVVSRVAADGNEYIFRDATGEMPVRITPRQFKGNKINPKTDVQLTGKIDRSSGGNEMTRLKVTSLEVIK